VPNEHVYQLTPNGKLKVRASGLEQVLGLAFRGGKLYALEMSFDPGKTAQVQEFGGLDWPGTRVGFSRTRRPSFPVGWPAPKTEPRREGALAEQCPRPESNQRTRFRKPLLYPLSYGGFLKLAPL
jgi:hypothetical protein